MDKSTVIIMYGAMTVAFVFLGYKFANKVIDISSELGAVIGLILSVALWYFIGKKLVKAAY